MLTYSGQCRGTMAPVDLGEFVTRMAPFLRTVREGSGAISYEVEPRVVVRGDTGQLQQLVVNLVENAQEAVAQAATEDQPGSVTVSVSTVEFTQTRILRAPASTGP
jgi:C4-dicarboxylate-specific signal transduction histidine kinase